MNLATVWWANRERRKYESRAEDLERRAERERDPRLKARLQLEAEHERSRARRFETGIRF